METIVKSIRSTNGKFSVMYKKGPREVSLTEQFSTEEEAKTFAREQAEKDGFTYKD